MKSLLSFLASLFVLPIFVPLEYFFPNVLDLYGKMTPQAWLYGSLTTTLIAILLLFVVNKLEKIINHFTPIILVQIKKYYLPLSLLICTSMLCLISDLVFNYRPHLIDSIAQVFQGKIFAGGSMTAPLPAFPEFFYTLNLLFNDQGISSQYPPLHALLLSIGERVQLIWIVGPILTISTLLIMSKLYHLILNRNEAIASTLLLAMCPFFLFMGGSYMNHISTVFFISLFCLVSYQYETTKKIRYLMLSGFSISCALTIRPLTSIAILSVYAFITLPLVFKRRHWLGLFGALLATLPAIILSLYYNFQTTGDPLLSGYLALWGEQHGLGFHSSPWGINYGLLEACQNLLINISMLNEFLLETPIPILILLPLLFIFGNITIWDKRFLLLALSIPLAYLFYWHRDSFLGPRFLFETIIFLIPLIIRGIFELNKIFLSKNNKYSFLQIDFSVMRCFYCLILTTILFSLFLNFPQRLSSYAQSSPVYKLDIKQLARNEAIERAIIFIPISWGSRIVSKLRTAGIPAWKVEQIYKAVDHCKLHEVVEDYWRFSHNLKLLNIKLEKLIIDQEPVQKVNLAGDSSLRLSETPLTPACLQELAYDQQGFTIFAPFLIDNTITLSGDLIIASDLKEHNEKLINQYPQHNVYYLRNNHLIKLTEEDD